MGFGNSSRGSKSWKYSQEDLENLFGVGRKRLLQMERQGLIVRGDIHSLFRYLMSKSCVNCFIGGRDGG